MFDYDFIKVLVLYKLEFYHGCLLSAYIIYCGHVIVIVINAYFSLLDWVLVAQKAKAFLGVYWQIIPRSQSEKLSNKYLNVTNTKKSWK